MIHSVFHSIDTVLHRFLAKVIGLCAITIHLLTVSTWLTRNNDHFPLLPPSIRATICEFLFTVKVERKRGQRWQFSRKLILASRREIFRRIMISSLENHPALLRVSKISCDRHKNIYIRNLEGWRNNRINISNQYRRGMKWNSLWIIHLYNYNSKDIFNKGKNWNR